MPAPIALFTFNRVFQTKRTLEALTLNSECKDSILFVFLDGPKTQNDLLAINEIKNILNSLDNFKQVIITEQKVNLGLAKSIIQGINLVFERYDRIIVLEDDIVVSKHFLKFMNDSLSFYEFNEIVWHISAWNYPISTDGLEDVFLTRIMNCWGWATWKKNWKYYDNDSHKIISSFSKEEIRKFNVDGTYDFWNQIILNNEGKIKTWAIFWYATIFKNKGLCVNPAQTTTLNIGFDNSGENTRSYTSIKQKLNQNELHLIQLQSEDKTALKRIKRYFRIDFFLRKFKYLAYSLGYK